MNPDSQPSSQASPRAAWKDWLLNLLLILAIVATVQWWRARPLASGTAPPLAGIAVDGRRIDLSDCRGRPLLVHFWATWCPVCKAMDGFVDSIAIDHPVVTVAMQSGDAAEIRGFLAESGLAFAVVPDPDGRIAERWGVHAVPATFVLDAQGRIDYSTVGISSEPGLRARLWAAGLGATSAPSPQGSRP